MESYSVKMLDGDHLVHHGIKGQQWGVKNGPPYPLDNKAASRKLNRLSNKLQQTKLDRDTYKKDLNRNNHTPFNPKNNPISKQVISHYDKKISKLEGKMSDYTKGLVSANKQISVEKISTTYYSTGLTTMRAVKTQANRYTVTDKKK